MTDPPEVWFRRASWGGTRWAGSYIPTHWKGLAVLLGGVWIALASFFVGSNFYEHNPLFYAMCCAFSVASIIAMLVVTKRH
jgi:hypothetical protein